MSAPAPIPATAHVANQQENDWLWNGGRPVEDDDLWRKQQAEDRAAEDEGL